MWEKKSSLKTWVEIDAAALRHNFSVFQKLAGADTSIMAVVKANAYGHGFTEVVKILALCSMLHATKLWFGVDSIDEALLIRNLKIKNPILILGYIPPERLEEVIENDISFSVYSSELLRVVTKRRWTKPPRMHIKIETGTNRLGIHFEEFAMVKSLLQKRADWVEGVYTHFADTENPQSSFWKEQIARFDEAGMFLKQVGANPMRHVASSAAALLYPEACYNMIRAGIGFYGLWPSPDVKHRVFNNTRPLVSHRLKPVLTWKTKIAQIKKIKKEETIGYDRTFKAPHDMTIAILPVGYWDGYDRRFSSNGEMLMKGERVPIVGRICMNMIMVDITGLKDVKEGDEAVLLGKQKEEEITAEELAEKIGTIHYEIIARINPLIVRTIVHDT